MLRCFPWGGFIAPARSSMDLLLARTSTLLISLPPGRDSVTRNITTLGDTYLGLPFTVGLPNDKAREMLAKGTLPMTRHTETP